MTATADALLLARLQFATNARSSFDPAMVDAAFFAGTSIRSNFPMNIGYGDVRKLFPRSPRLNFEEIARFA